MKLQALLGGKPREQQVEPISGQAASVQQPAEQQPAQPESVSGELKLDKHLSS